jgi:hypothetical protein
METMERKKPRPRRSFTPELKRAERKQQHIPRVLAQPQPNAIVAYVSTLHESVRKVAVDAWGPARYLSRPKEPYDGRGR